MQDPCDERHPARSHCRLRRARHARSALSRRLRRRAVAHSRRCDARQALLDRLRGAAGRRR
ncbi:hypothetical protein CA830_31980, partial [Burkholderia multivorans]